MLSHQGGVYTDQDQDFVDKLNKLIPLGRNGHE